MLERSVRVVGRARQFGIEGGDWRRWRQHHIERQAGLDRGLAHRAHLAVAVENAFAREPGAAARPLDDERQHLRLALGCQVRDIEPGAHAPEVVHAVGHRARHERRQRLDDRTGGSEDRSGRLDRCTHLGLDRQAPARVEQQPDLQALDRALEPLPVDRLRRQAHRVACVRLAECGHHQRGVFDRARHRTGDPPGIGRVDRDAAEAGLQREDSAPAGRQPHRAADVGADVQRPVPGRGRGAGAGAAAAGTFAQIPRIARERMKAREARREHAVVGHRRLAEDHRTRLAQPRGRRRIGCGRHELGGCGAERCRNAARRDVLLDRRRHAVERTERLALQPARLRGRGLRQGRVGIERIGGVQMRLPGLDVAQHRARHLDRRGGLAVVQVEQRAGAERVQVVGHRDRRKRVEACARAYCQRSAARSLAKIGELLHMPFRRLLPTANCGSWNR